jgi:hypothetical protein
MVASPPVRVDCEVSKEICVNLGRLVHVRDWKLASDRLCCFEGCVDGRSSINGSDHMSARRWVLVRE